MSTIIETTKTYTSLMDIRKNELTLIYNIKNGWRTGGRQVYFKFIDGLLAFEIKYTKELLQDTTALLEYHQRVRLDISTFASMFDYKIRFVRVSKPHIGGKPIQTVRQYLLFEQVA